MFQSSYNADYRQPADGAMCSMVEDWIDLAAAVDGEQGADICIFWCQWPNQNQTG
ncbi:MAG: hypothetical protein QGH37_22905 [Candidatus Poribacteria bacterium]|jgi:hypothetical protein|nr:hypothetical protein [Candidatus Poribacteria bacterium]